MLVAAVSAGVIILGSALHLHRRTSKKLEQERARAETRARHEREWNQFMATKQEQRH